MQPLHHATSETVWKVRLNRTYLDLTFYKHAFAEGIADTFSSIHIALISSEDPMRVELSLIAAEDLVRKNVFAVREVWQPHLEFSSMRPTPNLFITLDDVCFPD